MIPIPKLHPDEILPALPRAVWFSAVGAPLEENERIDCNSYIRGLGLDLDIAAVQNWSQACALAKSQYGPRQRWDKERAEERSLFEIAAGKSSPDALLIRLATLMEGSAQLFRAPAAVASTRAGIIDPDLVRCAAGAAAHSLHQFGLAQLAGPGDEHSFAAKFRLFLCGHWPLCVRDRKFYIF